MIPAKKSLGQHFLTDKSYLRAIVDALEEGAAAKTRAAPQTKFSTRTSHRENSFDFAPSFLRRNNAVVEIGPGKGSLTAELLSRGYNVIALEKDRRLIPYLEEKFAEEITARQLQIIEVDALKFEPVEYGLSAGNYQVVGNIPYYITGALIQKFLTTKSQPTTIVFLVQKEVAERIARSKKESLLSLSVKAYGTPKYIKTVPAGAFAPPPKVDSAILQISAMSRKNFKNAAHEKRFFELLHAGFAHKRKLLVRNLEAVFEKNLKNSRKDLTLRAFDIPPNARAEDVALEKWLTLGANL